MPHRAALNGNPVLLFCSCLKQLDVTCQVEMEFCGYVTQKKDIGNDTGDADGRS